MWIETNYWRESIAYRNVTSLAEVWIETYGRRSVRREPQVTSLAEVWIETSADTAYTVVVTVTSLAEVWIETLQHHLDPVRWRHFPCGSVDWNPSHAHSRNILRVTSLAEVWIETLLQYLRSIQLAVTSLAEVWIETVLKQPVLQEDLSLPLRKCGLKHALAFQICACPSSLPLRKCGLKPGWNPTIAEKATSLPLRKCGLKPAICRVLQSGPRHFPCGSVDWNVFVASDSASVFVTSLAEVWIETGAGIELSLPPQSLPLRKCGLKLTTQDQVKRSTGHFPCGSVDWNDLIQPVIQSKTCHFPCGSVDWNNPWNEHHWLKKVTSLAEVWIETTSFFESMKLFL